MNGRRVAFFLGALPSGGAERVTLDLAYGFHEVGYEVDLVVADASGPLIDQIPLGVNFVPLGSSRTGAALLPLRAYLRRRLPTALFSGLTHANVTAIAAGRLSGAKTNIVVTEHVHLSAEAGYAAVARDRVMPQPPV